MNADQMPEMEMDISQLHREDVYTDNRMGTIRCLTPVTPAGADDPSRPVRFVGAAQLLTPAGALPLSFEIEADSLATAVEKFAEGAQQAFTRTMEELKEMRREASSSIVVPQMDASGLMNPGGLPRGGKIQLP